MASRAGKPLRHVRPSRRAALGGLAAAMAAAAAAHPVALVTATGPRPGAMIPAAGEGGGEGEGGGAAQLEPGVAFLRDLALIEGHLRAGLALYEAGDLAAAKAHMGRPIKERYGTVAEALAERGLERLGAELEALAEAVEAGAPLADIRQLHDRVMASIDAARADTPTAERVAALVVLVRAAGDEYSAAIAEGRVVVPHEYQTSWGFIQVVRDELTRLAAADEAAAPVLGKMLAALAATAALFGDLQGRGDFTPDPSAIYGAAARMELAALRLPRE